MKLQEISINGNVSNSSGVGKKFLIISISLTLVLNASILAWFIFYVNKYGIEKFIS